MDTCNAGNDWGYHFPSQPEPIPVHNDRTMIFSQTTLPSSVNSGPTHQRSDQSVPGALWEHTALEACPAQAVGWLHPENLGKPIAASACTSPQWAHSIPECLKHTTSGLCSGLLATDLQRQLRINISAVIARAVRKLGLPTLRAAHIVNWLQCQVGAALALPRLAVFLNRLHCTSLLKARLLVSASSIRVLPDHRRLRAK